jgi:uncharacterized membrane protein YbhN (UPF0104 family)
MDSAGRKRWTRAAAVGGGLALGFFALSWVIRDAGVETTRHLVVRAMPWLPLALSIEALRIVVELLSARKLFAMLRSPLSLVPLARVQMVGYSIGNLLPAGRAVAEATKAGLLAPLTTVANAAAVATTSQGLHLLASAFVLLFSSLAALASLHEGLASALALQAAILAGAGMTVLGVSRMAPAEGKWFARLPRFGAGLQAFRRALHALPAVPAAPFAWILASRLLQIGSIATLAHAIGFRAGPIAAFMGEGILLTGASMGDFVPGQIGAVEGAFAIFASQLGTSKANAIALALLLHLVQTFWVIAGVFVLGYDVDKRPASRAPPRGITIVSP